MADMINHPAHYNHSEIEPIKAIEAWNLGFHLGNVIKYIARAGHKDPSKEIEDLKKARFYLDRKIKNLEKVQAKQAKSELVEIGITLTPKKKEDV